MDEVIQTTLNRAAALLAEAADHLRETLADAGKDENMTRGGTEYALGSARRAMALMEACRTLQDEAGA